MPAEPEWQPGRWWRILSPIGSLRCETSDEKEAREMMLPGDKLQRQWVKTEYQWCDVV